MFRKAWLLVFGFILFQSFTYRPRFEPFEDSFEKGDWTATVKFLENFYVYRGVSVSQNMEWHPVSTLNLYNFYNESSLNPAIVVSDYPTKDSIWLYWENWSEKLTHGKWKPKAFFKNKKDAKLMAHYNVLMLLSHELGHHIAHRYSIRNRQLNCFENLADLASMALVKDLEKIPYFNDLQKRYIQLTEDINQAIPAEHQFTKAANYSTGLCEEMDVKYPSDTIQMLQYASAYFVRRQHLHESLKQKDSKEILETVFLKEHLSWLDKQPQLRADMYLIKEQPNLFEYPASISRDLALNRYRFQPNFDARSGFMISTQQNAFHWKAVIPRDQSENTIITFDATMANGHLYNQWYYKCPENQQVEKTNVLSFYLNEIGAKPVILLEEEDSLSKKHLYLLSSDTGFYLKKTKLNLRTSKTVKIVGVEGNVVKLLQQFEQSDSTSKLSEVKFSLETQRGIMDRVVAIVPFSANKNLIQYATSSDNCYYFITGFYVVQLKDGIVSTVAGSGLFGNRPELKELQFPKAIGAIQGEVTVLDSRGYSSDEHRTITLKTIYLK